MKKKSTSTMSKFSLNKVPNSLIGPSPLPISTQKKTQSRGSPSWKEIDGHHELRMMTYWEMVC